MSEHLSIGSTPSHEDCAQVGTDGYAKRARAECRAYIAQLIDTFGVDGSLPIGIELHVHSNAHDFGTYYEVCVKYDADDDEATAYAFKLEDGAPEFWSTQALLDLKADGLDPVTQNPDGAGINV